MDPPRYQFYKRYTALPRELYTYQRNLLGANTVTASCYTPVPSVDPHYPNFVPSTDDYTYALLPVSAPAFKPCADTAVPEIHQKLLHELADDYAADRRRWQAAIITALAARTSTDHKTTSTTTTTTTATPTSSVRAFGSSTVVTADGGSDSDGLLVPFAILTLIAGYLPVPLIDQLQRLHYQLTTCLGVSVETHSQQHRLSFQSTLGIYQTVESTKTIENGSSETLGPAKWWLGHLSPEVDRVRPTELTRQALVRDLTRKSHLLAVQTPEQLIGHFADLMNAQFGEPMSSRLLEDQTAAWGAPPSGRLHDPMVLIADSIQLRVACVAIWTEALRRIAEEYSQGSDLKISRVSKDGAHEMMGERVHRLSLLTTCNHFSGDDDSADWNQYELVLCFMQRRVRH